MSTTAVRTIRHRIGGEETPGDSTRTAPVWDPATGEQQAEVLLAEAADVDRAVQTAKAAFEAWGDVSLSRRVKVMFAFRNLLHERLDDLARLISSEHGKVFEDAKGEVIRGIEVVEFACGLPQLLKGEYSDQVSTDVDAFSLPPAARRLRRHHAVQLPDHGAAVDAPGGDRDGNTFVLKPSERDPSVSTSSPSSTPRPGCPTASSTSSTATRWPSTRS